MGTKLASRPAPNEKPRLGNDTTSFRSRKALRRARWGAAISVAVLLPAVVIVWAIMNFIVYVWAGGGFGGIGGAGPEPTYTGLQNLIRAGSTVAAIALLYLCGSYFYRRSVRNSRSRRRP